MHRFSFSKICFPLLFANAFGEKRNTEKQQEKHTNGQLHRISEIISILFRPHVTQITVIADIAVSFA